LKIELSELFFVGDREEVDILPALKFGITTAIVNSSSNAASYELKKIYDLEKILLENN